MARHAAQVLQNESQAEILIDLIDLNDFDMPVYSPERQAEGISDAAHAFYAKIRAADGLIISFAEYNGTYTAAFKNIFDWTSRVKMEIFQNKPLLAMATSIVGRGGQNVLQAIVHAAPFFGGHVTSQFNFGPFAEHFDAEKNQLTSPNLARELCAALKAFESAV